jgi:hypothetical protein
MTQNIYVVILLQMPVHLISALSSI